MMATKRVAWAAVLLLAGMLASGCTTRSHSRAQAQAAFEAGQHSAFMEVGARQNGISFRGPVVNPVIMWTDGITLGQAMAAAGWRYPSDPQTIIISRGSETFEMTAAEALVAAEFPLEQGDLVEMRP